MSAGEARGAARRRVALTAALAVLLPLLAQAQSTECEPGEREVRSLEFRGNTVFRASDLALRVVTTSSDFARRSLRIVGAKRCLDSDELRLDVGRLRVFYRRHGYFSTRVDTLVAPVTDGYGGVRVAFNIHEGEPVRVDTLRITGLDTSIVQLADTSDLGLHPGIVFDLTRLQAGIDSIKTRLRNNGYPRPDATASFGRVETAARRAQVRTHLPPAAIP